jgi:uncharacterized flavoprotein (TIGR03862 family)
MTHKQQTVAVVGGGPAGLMAAETLARAGVAVTVYDRMPSLGRKFLLAGRGGLNLTHGEPLEKFLTRYGEAAGALAPAIEAFPPAALRAWAEELGEPTFVGSSGRVFPKSFKASPLLRAWLRRLAGLSVQTRLRHRLVGLGAGGALRFETPEGPVEVVADATVLALGGASWPRLGADGGWTGELARAGLDIAPLQPANCGFIVGWSPHLREKFAGAPLKSIALSFEGRVQRGEAVITERGVEGGAVYALSAPLRAAIAARGEARLLIDLRPDVGADDLARRLGKPHGGQSMATFLRKAAGLSPVAIALLREAGPLPADAEGLAARIKAMPIRLIAPASIERAISTAGGVRFAGLDGDLMARALPGVFLAGEMLDWEAPTGGYLLQACFASGVAAGRGALDFLKSHNKGK